MVICFEASPQAHAALEQLVASGRYRDVNGVISAALCNQAVLDTQVVATGGLIIQPGGGSGHGAPMQESARASVGVTALPSQLQRPTPPYDVTQVEAASLENPVDQNALMGPKNWPWGQFNKLLPVKVTCRVTLNLLLQNPGIKVTEAAEIVAVTATEFGDKLRQADEASRRRRDEAYAAAFPSPGSAHEKSRLRFMEQFVFGTGSFADNSFPQVLGFIRFDGAVVRLTPAGRKFGEFANPLIDGGYLQSAEKFSADELTFLRAHIKSNVPSERSALTAILRAIRDGAKNPDAIDAYLRQLFADAVAELTDPFLATQRTGVISRAVELKLMRRERQGVRVSYSLQEAGERFLES
jgi:hypothetical protein